MPLVTNAALLAAPYVGLVNDLNFLMIAVHHVKMLSSSVC